MPFVDGESLRDRLGREKQLPLDDALKIAREVADALGEHQYGPIRDRPEPGPARMRWNVALGTSAILALIALLWMMFGRGEPTLVAGNTTQVTLDPGLEVDPVISPDGQMIATRDDTVYYLSSGPPRWAIWSISTMGGTPTLLVDFDDPARQHTRYGFDVEQGRVYVTLGNHESDVWVMSFAER